MASWINKRAQLRIIFNSDRHPHIYWMRVFDNKWLVIGGGLQLLGQPARLASHALWSINELIFIHIFAAALILRGMMRAPPINPLLLLLSRDLSWVEFEYLIRGPHSIWVVIVRRIREMKLCWGAAPTSHHIVLIDFCYYLWMIVCTLQVLLIERIE